MRALTALCLLLALAGCKDRRSFDERYEATGNTIEDRARNLDAEINAVEQGNRGSDVGR